jgi:hypothetical protein
MKHRNRNMLAALLAAGLLVLSALGSAALAHGGPGRGPGWGGHDPWPTPKSHPTSQPTQKAKPSHLPKVIDCTKVPAPTGSPVSTAAPARAAADKLKPAASTKTTAAEVCSVAASKTAADKKIAAQIKSLSGLIVRAGKIAGLSTGDQAILTGEINGLIGDLTALKSKMDAETTLAGVQADLVTLSKDSVYARSIGDQVSLIDFAEFLIAQGPKFATLATTLTGQISAAPSGIDTAAAQTYLDDMKARVAAAEALAGPLPASLLALTPAQLQAGKGDPTLANARKSLWPACFDIWKAHLDARMVEWILAGKPGSEGKHDKSPAPSITPAPSLIPVPTATPV